MSTPAASVAAATSSGPPPAAETSSAPPPATESSSQKHHRAESRPSRSGKGSNQSRGRSASKRPGGNGKDGNSGPPNKKKRAFYTFKLNIYQGTSGSNQKEKLPISLPAWRVMNGKLCAAAAAKYRSDGPPKGGVGQKHWQEHSDGTRKTSELPEEERFGHAVIRFSTAEAMEWYRPLIWAVDGTTQDGTIITLKEEDESDDDRARYVCSLPAADFKQFGNTKEEAETLLRTVIIDAIGIRNGSDLARNCEYYSSFLFQEKGKDDLWKAGLKLPPQVEAMLDTILMGEKFGILPTAITSVRVLKKQNSLSVEKRLAGQVAKMAVGTQDRSDSTDPTKRNRSSSGGRSSSAAKKIAT